MSVFLYRGTAIPLHTANLNDNLHLHRKYVGRKWRMAHFVGCRQWVFSFSNIEEKEHSQYTGEATLNQRVALMLM